MEVKFKKQQKAENWKVLQTNSGRKAKGKLYSDIKSNVSDKKSAESYSQFATAVANVFEEAVKDIYGDKSQEKYVRIVDLIAERASESIPNIVNSIVDTSIDDLKKEVIDELNEKIAKNSALKDIPDEVIEEISEKIIFLVTVQFEERRDQLLKQLEELVNPKEKEENKEEKKEDDKKEQSEKKNNDKNDEKDAVKNEEIQKNDAINQALSEVDRLVEASSKMDKFVQEMSKKINDRMKRLNDMTLGKFISTPNEDVKLSFIQDKVAKVVGLVVKLFTPSKRKLKERKRFNDAMKSIKNVFKILKKFSHMIGDIIVDSIDYAMMKATIIIAEFLYKMLVKVIVPLTAVFGGLLKLIAEPLAAVLDPIMKIISSVVDIILSLIDACVNLIFAPLVKFFLHTLKEPLKIFFDRIATVLELVVNILAGVIEEIASNIVRFVFEVIGIFTSFLKGIGEEADKIGKSIGDFIIAIGNTILDLLSGLTVDDAIIIGEGIAKLVTDIIGVFTEFLDGLGSAAFFAGQEIAKFMTTTVAIMAAFFSGFREFGISKAFGKVIAVFVQQFAKFLPELVEFLMFNSKVYLEAADTIMQFFKGVGALSYEVGEAFGEYMMNVSKVRLAYIKEFKEHAAEIGKIFAEHLATDLSKIKIGLAKLAEDCGATPPDIAGNLVQMKRFLSMLENVKNTITSLENNKCNFETLWDIASAKMKVFDDYDSLIDYKYSLFKDTVSLKMRNSLLKKGDADNKKEMYEKVKRLKDITKTGIQLNKVFVNIKKGYEKIAKLADAENEKGLIHAVYLRTQNGFDTTIFSVTKFEEMFRSFIEYSTSLLTGKNEEQRKLIEHQNKLIEELDLNNSKDADEMFKKDDKQYDVLKNILDMMINADKFVKASSVEAEYAFNTVNTNYDKFIEKLNENGYGEK